MIEAGSDLAQLEAELQVNPICPPYHTALPERIGSDCLIEKDVICRSDACLVVDRPTQLSFLPPTRLPPMLRIECRTLVASYQ